MLLKKNKKNKREIRLELENSFIVGEKCENKDLAKKADKVEKCKVATDVIKEYKEIIKIKKKYNSSCVSTRQSF